MASTRIDAGREEVAASTGGASQGSSQEGPAQASRAPTPAGARIGTDWAASDEPDGSPRQAVVLIHGLGDQPPMRSLRSFTVGIGLPRLFSSPDRVTDSTELRRLSEPPTPHLRAHTDFFELYWAHLAPDADLRTSLSWGLQLLLSRRWWSVGGAAARLVIAFQIAMAALVALLLWGLVDAIVSGGLPGLRELLATWQVWLALALAVGGGFMGRLVRAYLSDAVRYLAPRPANIESRRRIREEGLTLLRRLHAGRYERIIIVGHSLGTVIGLDLVRSLWDELRHPDPCRAGDQAYAAVFDEACDRLDPGGPADGAQPVPAVSTAELDAFQAAQFDLWRAGRAAGVPWLISDFVSTVSPLTYAPLLLDEAECPSGAGPGSPSPTCRTARRCRAARPSTTSWRTRGSTAAATAIRAGSVGFGSGTRRRRSGPPAGPTSICPPGVCCAATSSAAPSPVISEPGCETCPSRSPRTADGPGCGAISRSRT